MKKYSFLILLIVVTNTFAQNAEITPNKTKITSYGYGTAFEILKIDTTNPPGQPTAYIRNESDSDAMTILNYGKSSNLGLYNWNASSTKPTLFINTTSNQAGIYSQVNGPGKAAYFATLNGSNTSPTLDVNSYGLGEAGKIELLNFSSTNPALFVNSNSSFGAIKAHSSSSSGKAIYADADYNGTAIYGLSNSEYTLAGHFQNSEKNNSGPTLLIETEGTGSGLFSNSKGHARSALLRNTSLTNINDVLLCQNYGLGNGIFADITNDANGATAIIAQTEGTGNAFATNHLGAGSSTTTQNNLAVFKHLGFNKVRIDKDGKGYFNGGTQNSGADIAEAFEIEDDKNQYAPGDVLVISTKSDRKVEKSSEAYSSLVVGVYATKPGVLLTEENIDTDLSEHIPVGVVGVIPTKVCNEGGSIKRGDLLVSSSISGYAMKADVNKVGFGQTLGKALENFDNKKGKIKVMVNVK